MSTVLFIIFVKVVVSVKGIKIVFFIIVKFNF
jgi:hypothetical protein